VAGVGGNDVRSRRTAFEGRAVALGDSEYRGLRVFAAPGLHGHVAQLAERQLSPGARVADLGSGTGAFALRLADMGYRVTACDLVAENFGAGECTRFVQTDLDGDILPGEEGAFDALFALEILEHLENPRRCLRRAFELLRPGGRLIVSTPNIASPASKARFVATGRFQWFSDKDRRDLGHITPISPWWLRDAVSSAGFQQIELSDYGDASAPLAGWRKVQLLARVLGLAARGSGDPQGDIALVCAVRP
jgi:SAM-dependent methyltransferase